VNQPKIKFSSVPSSTLITGIECKEGASQNNKNKMMQILKHMTIQ